MFVNVESLIYTSENFTQKTKLTCHFPIILWLPYFINVLLIILGIQNRVSKVQMQLYNN